MSDEKRAYFSVAFFFYYLLLFYFSLCFATATAAVAVAVVIVDEQRLLFYIMQIRFNTIINNHDQKKKVRIFMG